MMLSTQQAKLDPLVNNPTLAHQPPPFVIACRITKGADFGEQFFEIELLDGGHHVGFAPSHSFWKPDGKPFGANELSVTEWTPGLIAISLTAKSPEAALIATADGSINWVNTAAIRSQPAGTTAANPRG